MGEAAADGRVAGGRLAGGGKSTGGGGLWLSAVVGKELVELYGPPICTWTVVSGELVSGEYGEW